VSRDQLNTRLRELLIAEERDEGEDVLDSDTNMSVDELSDKENVE
jgi:hypothetical protein